MVVRPGLCLTWLETSKTGFLVTRLIFKPVAGRVTVTYARKLCYNLPKTQEKRPNLRVFHQKDADVVVYSEHPDQAASLGAV